MNDRDRAPMAAAMDAEPAQAEAALAAHPEHACRIENMRALALGLGGFGRMRAHDVHLLAAQMSSRRAV